jgi:hypothetical protein
MMKAGRLRPTSGALAEMINATAAWTRIARIVSDCLRRISVSHLYRGTINIRSPRESVSRPGRCPLDMSATVGPARVVANGLGRALAAPGAENSFRFDGDDRVWRAHAVARLAFARLSLDAFDLNLLVQRLLFVARAGRALLRR